MISLTKPTVGSVGWGDDVNQNFTDIEDAINQGALPAGSISMFGGAAAPSGWLLCDGSAVSRATYAALFAAIGTAFGVGDGSTTFNVPDLRGRAPIGAGQGSGLTDRTLGASLGAETHQLQTSELPSHGHGVTDPGHTHGLGVNHRGTAGSATACGPTFLSTSTGNLSFCVSGSPLVPAASTGISIQNAGGDDAHNNMQPCQVVTFIVKT